MQLTTRQREFVRIAGWALLFSVALGAVFGHFQAPNDTGRGYIHGVVAAILISGTILFLEFAIFRRTRRSAARRLPAVSAWLVRASAESEPLIERGAVIFSLILSLGFNLLSGVSDLLGQGVLFNFVAGRYRRPRIEERVLLFIDMEGSTAVAERLGEAGFLDFLNRFIGDVTELIVAQRGVIHKYVGDEIIVTWPLAAGLADGHCVRACFDALKKLDERAASYIRDFGLRANFRAALHCGPVVRRARRRQNGDRVPRRHHEHGGAPARGLPRDRPAHPCFRRVGELLGRFASRDRQALDRPATFRGKENETEIYALATAEAATRPSGEVTVLSSRSR